MKIRNRIRCPFCGMLTWDSQWNRDYPIEILAMNSIGRRKGVKGCFEYTRVNSPAVLDRMKYFIVERCKDIIERFSIPEHKSSIVVDYVPLVAYTHVAVPEPRQEVIFDGESEGVFGYGLHSVFLS